MPCYFNQISFVSHNLELVLERIFSTAAIPSTVATKGVDVLTKLKQHRRARSNQLTFQFGTSIDKINGQRRWMPKTKRVVWWSLHRMDWNADFNTFFFILHFHKQTKKKSWKKARNNFIQYTLIEKYHRFSIDREGGNNGGSAGIKIPGHHRLDESSSLSIFREARFISFHWCRRQWPGLARSGNPDRATRVVSSRRRRLALFGSPEAVSFLYGARLRS